MLRKASGLAQIQGPTRATKGRALGYNPLPKKRARCPNGLVENQKAESMKVIREMPDLFRLVGRLPINSYFVREDDGLTLVDANLPGRATRIVEIALRLELPIRRIVLTHAHMDHTGSLDTSASYCRARKFLSARANRACWSRISRWTAASRR